ncbi:MAG: DUF5677 domain-containing protein [Acetobacteraceae bacterium]
MSLESEGYLSPDVRSWIATHRSQNPELFGLADRMNRTAQRTMMGCAVPDNDNRALLVVLLFARGLSSFQDGVLMIERGMSVEALTLARSCLETSFYLAAIVRDPAAIEGMIGSDAKHKKKITRWLTGPGAAAADLPHEQTERLRAFLLRAATDGPAPGIADVARKAEMSEIYETVYRDLCDRAAHPSLNSLLRHVTQDAHGNVVGLRFGPETADTREVVLALVTSMFPAIHGLGKIFPIADDFTHEFNGCWETYVQLIAEQDAEASGSAPAA